MLVDRCNRRITYLRVSVTDRCNLRCVYCMPPEGVSWQPHESIMRYEEIARIIRIAAEEGIREVRLTGGEPLVRRNLADLIRLIAEIPGIEDISLTTNGILLADQAESLKAAGLNRINVSLDTMDPDKYTRITRGGNIQRVFEGLQKAEDVGLQPIKINMVLLKGVNDGEIQQLAALSKEHRWEIRFIELMPVKNQQKWGEGFPDPEDMFLPVSQVKVLLEPEGLVPVEKKTGAGPAEMYSFPNARGTIGFINPLSESFCENCNRLRLTADGNLRPCLLSDVEVPLLPTLRSGGDIRPLLYKAMEIKPENHELNRNIAPVARCMMQIGG
jgi:cyclic pyranopterin phosphate synthase